MKIIRESKHLLSRFDSSCAQRLFSIAKRSKGRGLGEAFGPSLGAVLGGPLGGGPGGRPWGRRAPWAGALGKLLELPALPACPPQTPKIKGNNQKSFFFFRQGERGGLGGVIFGPAGQKSPPSTGREITRRDEKFKANGTRNSELTGRSVSCC